MQPKPIVGEGGIAVANVEFGEHAITDNWCHKMLKNTGTKTRKVLGKKKSTGWRKWQTGKDDVGAAAPRLVLPVGEVQTS